MKSKSLNPQKWSTSGNSNKYRLLINNRRNQKVNKRLIKNSESGLKVWKYYIFSLKLKIRRISERSEFFCIILFIISGTKKGKEYQKGEVQAASSALSVISGRRPRPPKLPLRIAFCATCWNFAPNFLARPASPGFDGVPK